MAVTASTWGTLQVSDLLAVQKTAIIDFGHMDVYKAVANYLEAYNAQVQEEMGYFVDRTTDRMRGVGGPAAMVAHYVDEFGVDDVQKVSGPSALGFPLRNSVINRQWTYTWLSQHSPNELAVQLDAAMTGDRLKVQSAIRTAIFKPTNSTFTDRLRDNMAIPVKAFANADGFPIAASPNGLTFNPATHNHYMGSTGSGGTTLAAADVDALLLNVSEHYQGGQLILFVSKDVEATMLAGRYLATPTFPLYAPLVYTKQTIPNNAIFTQGMLEPSAGSSRMTGTYRDAEVWVKPWMPPATLFAFMSSDDNKPLAMRVPEGLAAASGDFGIVFQDSQIPLQCELMSRSFGVAPQNRTSGAVMSIGSSTYAQPAGL